MKVILGGTFSPFHMGHEALLSKAFEVGDVVFIGLTSEAMARRHRMRPVRPYEERERALRSYCDGKVEEQKENHGRSVEYHIRELEDFYALTPESQDADAVVVSMETKDVVKEINEVRAAHSLKPYKAFVVAHVLAQDGRPIKASRIAANEIDRSGKLLRPLRVCVGSQNPVKVNAARSVISEIFHEAHIKGVEVESGVPKQPRGDETINGAINRSKAALQIGIDGKEDQVADLGIGIEAGLFWSEPLGEYVDIQFCAISDQLGRTTMGHGGGFVYPKPVVKMVEAGSTVGEAIKEVFGEDPSRDIGAVGLLSEGLLTREELTGMAVKCAMIPRISQNRGYLQPDEDDNH